MHEGVQVEEGGRVCAVQRSAAQCRAVLCAWIETEIERGEGGRERESVCVCESGIRLMRWQ